jgi:hypothetical protein
MEPDAGRRFSEGFHFCAEHVTYSALGLDEASRAWIFLELAPQPQNLHVDATVEDVFVHSRGLKNVFAAERTSFCQGDLGAIGLSRMPIVRSRRLTAVP